MCYTTDVKKYAFSLILDTLHTLALAVWLGGLLIIGMAVAPAAFRDVPGLSRMQSGMVVGESLRRFGGIILFCGVIMLAAQFLTRRRYRHDRSLFISDSVRHLLTFAALFLAEFGRQSLFPAMDAARSANKMPEFDRLHHTFSTLSMIQVWILAGIAALTAWLHLPRLVQRTEGMKTEARGMSGQAEGQGTAQPNTQRPTPNPQSPARTRPRKKAAR